jgi:hypothetical protein
MPVILGGLAVASLAAGAASNRSAKKRAAKQAFLAERQLAQEAASAERELFVQAEAANTQRKFIQDNLLLEAKAKEEAERQARAGTAEITLGDTAEEREAARRRRRESFAEVSR